MVKIAPFKVEQWMEAHDASAIYSISESCSASISISQLQALSADPSVSPINLDGIQGYGSIKGSDALRKNVTNLFPNADLTPANVLITPGAIQANFLVFYALIGPDDHVICHYPTYQQLYSVPESFGATVTLWKAKHENAWQLDINELEKLITPSTKMIVLNNPNNPTGGYIPKSDLKRIVEIASAKNIYVFSDEVYRPMFHSIAKDDPELPPSIIELGYNRAIATGSMSKAFALAGLRLGWIVAHDLDVMQKCFEARDYTTISCSVISDSVSTYALSRGTVDNLLERNNALARKNVQILDDFIRSYPDKVNWIRPKSGTTGFVQFLKNGQPVEDDEFCEDVTTKTGVYFVPGGRCFGDGDEFKGHVRIGYACETEVLEQALDKMKGYVESEL